VKQLLNLILLGAVTITLISCGSDPKKEDTGAIDSGTDETRTVTKDEGPVSTNDLEQGLLAKRIIYFEFNQAIINDDDREFISAHAKYLSDNSGTKVVLEGHADERGTREYNISLGERRAKAVMQLLVLQGASKSQLQVISFGEERPVALGHDESSWAQNRRVELMY